MPVAVAQRAGTPSEKEMARQIERAGVTGALLNGLRAYYTIRQIWDALQHGHTAASLQAFLLNANAQAAAQPAAQPAVAQGAAAQPAAQPAPASKKHQRKAQPGWWDSFFAAGGWTFLVGLVWCLNGLGTVVAVITAVTSTIPAAWTWAGLSTIHPLLPLLPSALLGGLLGVYYWRYTQRSIPDLTIRILLAAGMLWWLTGTPWTATRVGWILGLIVHLTISKTELLYWGAALFTWRILPLLTAITADVLTSTQGLLTVAYRLRWNWIVGTEPIERLPASIIQWVQPIQVLWVRFRSSGTPEALLPAFPPWTTRATVIIVVVAIIALGTERAFRYVWRDFKVVWNHRPF